MQAKNSTSTVQRVSRISSVNLFIVFVSQIRNNKVHVLGELESALSEQTPPTQQENPSLHELPHLVMDGIPTPVDKMTQVCCIYDYTTEGMSNLLL